MLAKILRSVLLPEPFWPAIPKNSPRWMSNETSTSARSSRYSIRRKGCAARSFSVSIRCSGTRKDLWRPRASIATGAASMAVEPSTVAAHPRQGAPDLSVPLVVALTVVGLALRAAVSSQDLFADELSTYWIVSTNDFGGVLSAVNSDAEITPPLSFLLAWLSTQIHLSAEFLRLPSVIAGTLTIPALFWLGLRTAGGAAALVAAALTALAPFTVYYSAEARGYAVMMAFVVLSTLALLAAVDRRRAWAWVLYALFS